MEVFYALLSIGLVSAISLVGIITLIIKNKTIQKNLQIYLISFAAGAMLSTVFLHMIPESIEKINDLKTIGFLILLGIILSFILEKIICWRHCHLPITKTHKHHFAYLNIFGDFFHNFLDGIGIMAAFKLNFTLGLSTSLSVILHEIPQEIGDFGVLVYSGFSYKKALIYNLLTALSAFLGAFYVLTFPNLIPIHFFIPIIAGNFIYLSTADLIPELHKETELKKSLLQLLFFLLGVGLIWIVV